MKLPSSPLKIIYIYLNHCNPQFIDNLMAAQNFNADLMRQMQQQLNPLAAAQQQSQQAASGGLGQLPNQLLMSAFQGQQTQNNPLAENILAVALAAANNNNNSNASNSNHNANPTQQGQQTQQPPQQQQPSQSQMQQPSALSGLEGLDQLQNFNPLQTSVNSQNNANPFPSIGGLQGLQQQLATLQQQVQQQLGQQQGQQAQQQNSLQQQQQQQPSNTNGQQSQAQQGQFQTWMQTTGGVTSGSFNPAAFGLAGTLTRGDQNTTVNNSNSMVMDQFNSLMAGNPTLNNMIQGNAATNLMMGANSMGTFPQQPQAPQQQQQQQQQHQMMNLQQNQFGLSVPFGHPIMVANVANGKQNAGNKNVQFQTLFPQSANPVGFPVATAAINSLPPLVGSRGGVSKQRKDKKKRAKTFPEKLMGALMEYTDEEAVAWLPDGKSFVIVNPDIFCRDVLNKIFKEAKYASFVRKLHRWGFVRLTSGTGTDCFHHPMFQRSKKEMAGKIHCTPRDAKEKERSSERLVKPPSLAGVEKFIRAKVSQVLGGTRHEEIDDEDDNNGDSLKDGSDDDTNNTGEKEEEKPSADDVSSLLPPQSSEASTSDIVDGLENPSESGLDNPSEPTVSVDI